MTHVRVFRHYIHFPYIMLALLDAAVMVSCTYLAVFFRFYGDTGYFMGGLPYVADAAVMFALVNLVTMLAMGVYPSRTHEGMSGMMLRTIMALVAGMALLALLNQLFVDWLWYLNPDVLTFATLLTVLGMGIARSLFFFVLGEDAFKRRVLVLGAGRRAAQLLEDLKDPYDQRGFEFAGFVPTDGEQISVRGEQVIDPHRQLHHYLQDHPEIDELVIAMDDRRKKLPVEDLLECKMLGVSIVDGATFCEREGRKIPLDLLNPSWMIFSDGFATVSARNLGKRLFDVLASLALLGVTWPFMVLTALAIKLEEGARAPVFYRQVRVGEGGKPFEIVKFRSMRIDAEKSGAQWATKNDNRVTRVGAFIRKVRIDELPQIFNVLKGDMAFVGPRPERPVFVEQLVKRIPYYNERHRVKPGITGWAQLCFAYADDEEDTKEKLRYDLYYIKNQSLLLDLVILIQTVEVVLFKKGAH
ncbi:MAG: TIGR03013 family PEP-CTERM/XrtA system glycosyltransferase [Gammaproteobacteria bacterium]|nr:MAG: TIGR03013 family PEP-CTERM/XrtA system glycosyltransferase [Gammaproteobacteria bacterium]